MQQALSILKSRHAIWLGVTFAAGTLAIMAFILHANNFPNRGGTILGYTFGILATLFLLAAAMLAIRKRLKWLAIGRTEIWLEAHIWLGVLSLLLGLLHSAFMVSGLLSWLLMIVFFLTVMSGVLGSIMQKVVPPMLTGAVSYESLAQSIPAKIDRMRERAVEMIAARDQTVRSGLEKQVLPLFIRSRLGAKHLLRRFQRKAYLAMLFNHLAMILPINEKATVESLRDLAIEKEDLEFQAAAVRVLGSWLYVHVPLSTALLALLALHILQVFYYGNPL